MSRTVAVLGGGIAGMSAAFELLRRGGTRVVVLEASGRLGGKIAGAPFAGRTIDVGPDSFLARRPEALELCDELGMEADLVAPGVSGAAVWSRSRLRTLPSSLVLGVPTRLAPLARSGICSPSGVLRASLDLVAFPGAGDRRRPQASDVSVGKVVRSSLGEQVHSRLVDPLVGGINAGRTDSLSCMTVFPDLYRAWLRGGSIMRTLGRSRNESESTQSSEPVFLAPKDGMHQLAERLGKEIESRGARIALETSVERIEKAGTTWAISTTKGRFDADAVVAALPAPSSAEVLRGIDEALSELLASIDYSSVCVVNVRFAGQALGALPPGTGFLVPATEGKLVTACTWSSTKWPQLSMEGHHIVRLSLGRQGDTRYESMSDDEIVSRSVRELGEILARDVRPLETLVTRWKCAFPQFAVGHLDKVAAIKTTAISHGSLSVAGAALGGVGIPACIASGRAAAANVIDALGK